MTRLTKLAIALSGATSLAAGELSAQTAEGKPNATKFSYTIWAQGLISSGDGLKTANTVYGEIACSTVTRKRTCNWRDGNKTSR
jgi:hypothetical protein